MGYIVQQLKEKPKTCFAIYCIQKPFNGASNVSVRCFDFIKNVATEKEAIDSIIEANNDITRFMAMKVII